MQQINYGIYRGDIEEKQRKKNEHLRPPSNTSISKLVLEVGAQLQGPVHTTGFPVWLRHSKT